MADDNKNNNLDNLLNDALADFDKTAAKKNSQATDASNGTADAGPSSEFSDDPDAFFLDQAKKLAERMNTVFGGTAETPSSNEPALPENTEQIMAGFKKMAEAAALSLEGKNTASDEVAKYSDSIAQALKSLQEGTDNLNNPVSGDDVANMFSGLNMDDSSDGDGNMFLPFMEGMMQSLMSAEILLPSIKELLEKYPKYLSENADKLNAEDKERFEKQFELYKVIEGHLEQENPADSAELKREKFKIVLEDMRKLQEYGQPPEEILAETAGEFPSLDPTGAAAAAGGGVGGPQCPTM